MGRNHFAKTFASPYFQSEYYKNETAGGKMEQRIERWFKRFSVLWMFSIIFIFGFLTIVVLIIVVFIFMIIFVIVFIILLIIIIIS